MIILIDMGGPEFKMGIWETDLVTIYGIIRNVQSIEKYDSP